MLAVLCSAPQAGAQPTQHDTHAASPAARAAFESGRDAYDRGRFAEALQHFERAYELSGHPKLWFNIARAAESEGRNERAIEAYAAYLRALPEADNREFVQARLSNLQRRSDPPASAPVAPASAAPGGPLASATSASPDVAPLATAAPPAGSLTPQGVGSPVQAAASAQREPGTFTLTPAKGLGAQSDDAPRRPFWKRGWFWGTVGVAVVGAATAAVLLSVDRAPARVEADERIMTLEIR